MSKKRNGAKKSKHPSYAPGKSNAPASGRGGGASSPPKSSAAPASSAGSSGLATAQSSGSSAVANVVIPANAKIPGDLVDGSINGSPSKPTLNGTNGVGHSADAKELKNEDIKLDGPAVAPAAAESKPSADTKSTESTSAPASPSADSATAASKTSAESASSDKASQENAEKAAAQTDAKAGDNKVSDSASAGEKNDAKPADHQEQTKGSVASESAASAAEKTADDNSAEAKPAEAKPADAKADSDNGASEKDGDKDKADSPPESPRHPGHSAADRRSSAKFKAAVEQRASGKSRSAAAVDLTDEDTAFFSQADVAVEKMHREALDDDHHHDHRPVRVLTRADVERRAKLQKIVTWTIALSAILAGIGLISHMLKAKPAATSESEMPRSLVTTGQTSTQSATANAAKTSATAEPSASAASADSASPALSASAAASASASASAAVSASAAASASAAPGDVDPEKAKALAKKAESMLNQGRFADAITHAEQSVSADPSDAQAYMVWGVSLMEMGKMGEAKKIFARCASEATKGPKGDCQRFK